jgi:tetratricopeptide (TPR) repeat protein
MPPEPMRPLPTAAEMDKLAVAFRDNPRSTAFLPLADAYLALGRPREAIDTLNRGLLSHPDHAEALVALGRAHVLLHQWKEAQVELLKVVKLDRQSREGFRLLGEVLMRRQDFPRALPILQHAASLDPADARVLGMLRKAREGRPLDPPPPTPTPIAPAGSSGGAPRGGRGGGDFGDAAATRVADEGYARAVSENSLQVDDDDQPSQLGEDAATRIRDDGAPLGRPARKSGPPPPGPPRPPPRTSAPPPTQPRGSDDVLARVPLAQQQQRAAEERPVRRADARASEPPPPRRSPVPPPEDPLRPLTDRRSPGQDLAALAAEEPPMNAPFDGGGGAGSPGGQADPPRPQVKRPAEMPRGLQAAPGKSKDLGAGDMRRSAAVGEDYLNQLLVGGLLSVPNVEAREAHGDPEMKRRWRRKTRNAFIVLFVLLVLGAGGAGGWVFYSNQLRDREVAVHLDAARAAMLQGRQVDLARAETELKAAYRRDPSSTLIIATLAEASALDYYIFGAGKLAELDNFLSAASKRLRNTGDSTAGKREFTIALAARNLAVIDKAQEPTQVLSETRKALDGALKLASGDGMLLYLDGALRLLQGDREGARASFEKSDAGGKGPSIARISIGDLLLDDGDAQGAQTAYEVALARAPERNQGHPLALIGSALARVERSTDAEAAMQDLNVGLSGAEGTRTEAWKHVALATVWAYLEDYEKAQTELDAAQKTGLVEPRFQARIALAMLKRGKVTDAGQLRQRVKYIGDAPGRDPLLLLLDAELFMASGMPEDALAAVGENPTLRGRLLRGRALLDTGKPAQAIPEFEAALKLAPEDAQAKAYLLLAQIQNGKAGGSKAADTAYEALGKLARGSVSGLVRYVFAEADLTLGKGEDARRDLEASIEGGDNPLAYRARTRLAEVYLGAGRVDDASKALDEALAQSPLYVPAHSARGRILLAQGKTAEAVKELEPAVSANRATAAELVAYADALVKTGKKEEAKAPLRKAKELGASPDAFGPIAAAIDPAFAEELGAKGAAPPSDEKPKPKRHHRGH